MPLEHPLWSQVHRVFGDMQCGPVLAGLVDSSCPLPLHHAHFLAIPRAHSRPRIVGSGATLRCSGMLCGPWSSPGTSVHHGQRNIFFCNERANRMIGHGSTPLRTCFLEASQQRAGIEQHSIGMRGRYASSAPLLPRSTISPIGRWSCTSLLSSVRFQLYTCACNLGGL